MHCPQCGTSVREDAKFCTRCGALLRRTTGSSERPEDPDSYPSVYRGAKPADFVEKMGPKAQPPPIGYSPPVWPGSTVYDRSLGAIGSERSVPLWVILSIFTGGIGLLIWIYKVSKELRVCSGGNDPNPGLDVLLTIVTCGLWDIYLGYKYTRHINQIRRLLRLPEIQVLPIVLVFSIVGLFLVSIAILQNELNEVWRHLRTHPPAS